MDRHLARILGIVLVAVLVGVTVIVVVRSSSNDRAQLLELVADLRAELAAERNEDQVEFEQDNCEGEFARAITRATDAVNSAEAVAFLSLTNGRGPEFDAAADTYAAAAKAFTDARQARDDYIAAGSPLPCPI